MKKIKKVLSLLLCLAAVISMSMPVHAATEIGIVDAVHATVGDVADAEWNAEIPACIVPEGLGNQDPSAYSVTVNDVVLPKDTHLEIRTEYDGLLTEENGAELPYALYTSEGVIASGGKIASKYSDSSDSSVTTYFGAALTDQPKYAGVYTGSVTFDFAVKPKVYTPEEIEADNHLFGIGKTRLEYVIAKFNEDFTTVTIFQNGDESDGLMMDWESSGKSPMCQHRTTLAACTIQEGVTSIGRFAFDGCSKMTGELVFPQSLKSIGWNAFAWCIKLTGDLILPNNVTTIEDSAFFECKELNGHLTLPDRLDLVNQFVFGGCSFTGELVIPKGVTKIRSAAFMDNAFTGVSIPNSVVSIDDSAFWGNNALETLTIPKGVEEIDRMAFAYCKNLTSVSLPSTVVHMGENPFAGCYNLAKILLDSQNTSLILDHNALLTQDKTRIISYPTKSVDTEYIIPDEVQKIDDNVFEFCTQLICELKLPSGLTHIGDSAFRQCYGLKGSPMISANVTHIGSDAFQGIGVTAFRVDEANKNYSEMDGVLFNKTKTDLICYPAGKETADYIIPDGVTTIQHYAFYSCSALKTVYIPSTVKSISDFINCYNLTTIYGASNSYAQTWAESHGYTFIAQ